MYLTAEQREIGKRNFLACLGSLRGDFLTKSLSASRVGSYYFGYGAPPAKPVRAAIVGTGNEGCEAMIKQSPPEYLEFVAYHDIRPTQIERGRRYFQTLYGKDAGSKVRFYDSYPAMLADKDVEAVVIATPLWTHADFAIAALSAGKHVLCEKLMAHNIADAKKMVQAAEAARKVLAIGHQRHYSTLYDNALAVVQSGVLGDIKHIRAFWHRNNTWRLPDGTSGDSWNPPIPAGDQSVDFKKYGYKSLRELVCWRLFHRTGGGLMAELGSHQLDACSLFLNKVHPEFVQGTGGIFFFSDDRECEDHVYCSFQMPGGVVVTYSSINTNSLDGYGEEVLGTKGSLLVLNERDVMLFKERAPGDKWPSADMRLVAGKTLEGTGNPSLPPEAALAEVALRKSAWFTPKGANAAMGNRGYHEEMEAFAHAVRNPGATVRCDGRVALADAVMALTANVAMRSRQRITFQKEWYDPAKRETPDHAKNGALAGAG